MNRRHLGFVVRYANLPGLKGLDGFLLAEPRGEAGGVLTAKSCYSVETATVFADRAEAQRVAEAHPALCGEGHSLPEVMPVWEETRRTLTPPPAEALAGLRETLQALGRR